MRYADPAAQAEIDRLTAGANWTPPAPDEKPTPAQMWAVLLNADAETRLTILAHINNALDGYSRCFVANHDHEIARIPGRLAAAWDQGWVAGFDDRDALDHDPRGPHDEHSPDPRPRVTPNPYRVAP